MGDMASFCLLSIAVFCGAFVSGLAGFAFSAVAGAILLHVLPPREAVPLMMACSITVQAAGLWALRKSICWKQSSGLVVGGLLGVPIAVWLLQAADARIAATTAIGPRRKASASSARRPLRASRSIGPDGRIASSLAIRCCLAELSIQVACGSSSIALSRS